MDKANDTIEAMNDLSVTVKVTGGTPIEHAAVQACALATRLGIWVNFEFNGVDCNAAPHSDPQLLAERQQQAQNSKMRYPMAFAHSHTETTVEPHTCPYKVEINDDSETLCTCGPEKTQDCRDDI